MAKVDFKLEYSVSGKFSQRKFSKFYKDEQEANCFCRFGIKGDVEERGNNESSTCPRGVFEQLIPCGEIDGVYHPVINLKMLNQFITFLHFKMEDRVVGLLSSTLQAVEPAKIQWRFF